MIALGLGVVLLGVTAACSAALLRVRGLVAFGLAAAVIAFADVVAVSHALSAVDRYERTWFLSFLAVIALGAAAAAVVARPPWPSPHRGGVVRELLGDRVLAALAAVVLAELAYLTALGLFTPPVERDALSYHLMRALLWIQDGSVGFNAETTDSRINDFPPDSSLLQGWTMLLSGSVRWVAVPQLGALIVAIGAVYGIAGRIGLHRREAAFGALLVPTLPVIALQAPTALNDLIVGALVAVAAFFALGRSSAELVLSAAAVALLVGTKTTGYFAVPVLLAVALCANRGARLVAAVGLGGVALVAGSAWYAIHAWSSEAGRATHGRYIAGDQGIVAVTIRATRYAVEAVELPGAGGRDRFVYLLAAAVLAAGAAMTRRRRSAGIAAALAALPVLVLPLERVLHSVYWNGWELIGHSEASGLGTIEDPTVASNVQSWYGPVGLVLTALALVLVVRAVRRRTLPLVALVLVAAPVAFVVESAATTGYHELSGRYAMGGVILSAATWGRFRTWTPGAVALVAVAAVTTLLVLVNNAERPAGIDLVEGTDRPSIWTWPREWAQSIEPEIARSIGYADDNVPDGEPIAVSRDMPYPFAFAGYPSLEHRIVYADTLAEATRVGARWAVLADNVPNAPGWRVALDTPPWAVYESIR